MGMIITNQKTAKENADDLIDKFINSKASEKLIIILPEAKEFALIAIELAIDEAFSAGRKSFLLDVKNEILKM